jgi:hypothetical protein
MPEMAANLRASLHPYPASAGIATRMCGAIQQPVDAEHLMWQDFVMLAHHPN